MRKIAFLILISFGKFGLSQNLVSNDSAALYSLFGTSPNIDTLYIAYSDYSKPLCKEIRLFEELKVLICHGSIDGITLDLYSLQKLEYLSLQHNNIDSMPDGISKLKRLKVLDLMNTSISKIPSDIYDLDSLTTLNLANTCVVELPDSLWELPNLQRLFFCLRNLNELPYEVSRISSLQEVNTRICSRSKCVIRKHSIDEENTFRDWLRISLPNSKVY